MPLISATLARAGAVCMCLGLTVPATLAQDASVPTVTTVESTELAPSTGDATLDTTVEPTSDNLDLSLDSPTADSAGTQPWLPRDGKPYWSKSADFATAPESADVATAQKPGWMPSEGQPPWATHQGQPEWAGSPSREITTGAPPAMSGLAANQGSHGRGRNR
jgi:hypothetical protein